MSEPWGIMLDFASMRNPATEVPGTPVTVSASRCQSAGISLAFAGLAGTVVKAESGEVLVHLNEASQTRHAAIESTAFSDAFRDIGEMQWFCSGVLEVVQESEESSELVSRA